MRHTKSDIVTDWFTHRARPQLIHQLLRQKKSGKSPHFLPDWFFAYKEHF